jgi:hypothetical protein
VNDEMPKPLVAHLTTLAMVLVHMAVWAPVVFLLTASIPAHRTLFQDFHMLVRGTAAPVFNASAWVVQHTAWLRYILALALAGDTIVLGLLNRGGKRNRLFGWLWFVVLVGLAVTATLWLEVGIWQCVKGALKPR